MIEIWKFSTLFHIVSPPILPGWLTSQKKLLLFPPALGRRSSMSCAFRGHKGKYKAYTQRTNTHNHIPFLHWQRTETTSLSISRWQSRTGRSVQAGRQWHTIRGHGHCFLLYVFSSGSGKLLLTSFVPYAGNRSIVSQLQSHFSQLDLWRLPDS